MSYFLEGTSEELKLTVLRRSRHHWISIEDKVRKWVELNWARWEEEQPEWFTDARKAQVPVEFIPTADAKRRESVRRASVDATAEGGGLGGAPRASMRKASVGSAFGGGARVSPEQ